MRLIIVASQEVYEKACAELNPDLWRILLPSLYSTTWTSSKKEVDISIVSQHLTRFESIYIEDGQRLEAITLLQHAIQSLQIKEYYLCDFESVEDIAFSIENSYFVDQKHAASKAAEHKIGLLFSTKLSKAIKAYAINQRLQLYKQSAVRSSAEETSKQIRLWHKQLQSFFVLFPTIPGLYWIVKAERTILKHDPRKLHRVYVQYKKDQIEFTIPYNRVYTEEFSQERNDTVDYFNNPMYRHVVSYFQTETKDIPPIYRPVVLSFLQSKLFYLYNFKIEYTTKLAKRLHQAGLITDPITNSYFVPLETSFALIRMLNRKYGEEYVLQSPRASKVIDEGKVAILPVLFDDEHRPENLRSTTQFNKISFESDVMRDHTVLVYELIYAITEWIQMKDAVYDSSVIQIKVGDKELEARAHNMVDVYSPEQGKNVPQTSWKNKNVELLNALTAGAAEADGIQRIVVLPRCSYNETLTCLGANHAANIQKRPPRYGVGRFNTQILGAKGIGTAESFHIIQNNLTISGLVVLANTMLIPQQIALETIDWCEKFAPLLLQESSIHDYWDRLNRIRFEGDDPEKLISEYEYYVNEVLSLAGYEEEGTGVSEAQIKLAKAIVIQRDLKIDNPDEFFSNKEKVKQLLQVYSIDEIKEESPLFKCPICRRGHVYQRDFINTETKEVSPYYACENIDCFRIYDNKVDEFFLHKKKDLNVSERIDALKLIASKQHLKNKGYLFTNFVGRNDKPYDAKVIFDTYLDSKKVVRYTLKVIF